MNGFVIQNPLALDRSVVQRGQTLSGTVTYVNNTNAAVTIGDMVIAARPPGGTHAGGPYLDLSPTTGAITVQPGATRTLTASRLFTGEDALGQWEAYPTYRDANEVWHDGPSVFFTVVVVETHPPSGFVACNRVRFYPRPGNASRMLNGRIEGSNLNETNGFEVLATISTEPTEGQWNELTFTNAKPYRYIKYYSPDGAYGNVAEVEFYNTSTRLYGRGFGSAGSASGTETFDKALDGDTTTWFDASNPSGNYVGIDIASPDSIVAAPTFNPGGGRYASTQTVNLTSATANATIRYTLDGSNPSATHGESYSNAITVSSSTTVKAIAFRADMFDSPVASATYTIGSVNIDGLTTYHIGNSLTDTINNWMDPIADSAGYNHVFYRSTIPGAGISWNWDHAGAAMGESDYREVFRTKAPLDALLLQIFPNPPGQVVDGDACRNFYNLAVQNSPNIQLYLYMSWPAVDGQSNNYNSASWQDPPWDAPYDRATNFEQAVDNTAAYNEALRARVDSEIGGNTVYIVPGAVALKTLKTRILAGQVPGITDFDGMMADGIHLDAKGAYFIGLVHYAVLYKNNPKGKVTIANSTLNQVQADLFADIAWEVVSTYAWSGVQ